MKTEGGAKWTLIRQTHIHMLFLVALLKKTIREKSDQFSLECQLNVSLLLNFNVLAGYMVYELYNLPVAPKLESMLIQCRVHTW